MSDPNEVVMTAEGLAELKAELDERLTETRNKIAEDIELARQQGDLSENAAYKAAMEDKDFNEERIEQLQNLVQHALVKKGSKKNDSVELGEEFVLVNVAADRKTTYKLVGSNEADPAEGKISIESPIGKAVEGKHYDEKIVIKLPSGDVEFVIKKK